MSKQKFLKTQLAGRNFALQSFKDLLRQDKATVWPIYGPSGIGKTSLLERFHDHCIEQNIACLRIDWEYFSSGKSAIDAVSLFCQSIVLPNTMADDYSARLPKKFTHKAWWASVKTNSTGDSMERAIAHSSDAGVDENVQQSAGLLNLILTLFGKFSAYLILGRCPEKTLLQALRKDAKRGKLVLFVDNHNVFSQCSIKTHLRRDESTWIWDRHAKSEVSLKEYLQQMLWYLTEVKATPLFVISGHYPVKNLGLSVPGLRSIAARELNFLAPYDIDELISGLEKELDMPKTTGIFQDQSEKDRVIRQISYLTGGRPPLVRDCLGLMRQWLTSGQDNGSIWERWEEEVEMPLKTHPGIGFDGLIRLHLFKTIKDLQAISDALWKLAVPLRIYRDSKLENILFPNGKEVFKRLNSDGSVLEDRDEFSYQLHPLDKAALLAIANQHKEARNQLHSQLFTYYKQTGDLEAASYHRLCGPERPRLEKLGITPEDYWQSIVSTIGIRASERDKWRLLELPNDTSLKKRIKRLNVEKNLFQELCGDSNHILSELLASSEITLEELEQSDPLDRLIKQYPNYSDLYFLKARQLEETDPEHALSIYQTIINQINPAHPFAWFRMGLHVIEQNRATAMEAFYRALQLDLHGLPASYARAHINWFEGRYGASEMEFKKRIDANVDIERDCMDLARLQIYLDHPDDALGVLDKVADQPKTLKLRHIAEHRMLDDKKAQSDTKTFPDDPEKFDQDAKNPPPASVKDTNQKFQSPGHEQDISADTKPKNDRTGQDDNEWIIRHYRKVIALDDQDAADYYNLGLAQYKQGEIDQAIEHYRKAIALDDQFVLAYNNLGNALQDQGEIDQAIEHCRKAIALDDQCVLAYNNLGNALQDQGEIDQAIEHYRKAIALDDQFVLAYNNLGIALQDQGEIDQAIEHYRKAIALDDQCALAYNNLGLVLHDQGEIEQAIEQFHNAIGVKPDFFEAWHNLAVVNQNLLSGLDKYYFDIGSVILSVKKRIATMEQYLRMAREVWGAYGFWHEAKECMEKALALSLEIPSVLAYAAEVNLELKDLKAATCQIDQLQKYSADSPEVLYPLARLLSLRGDTDEARQKLREYYDYFETSFKQYNYRKLIQLAKIFWRLDEPDYAERAALAAADLGAPAGLDIHSAALRLRAEIVWKCAKNPIKATRLLGELLETQSGRRPAVYLTDAELALKSGDFYRCRLRLASIKNLSTGLLTEDECKQLNWIERRCF